MSALPKPRPVNLDSRDRFRTRDDDKWILDQPIEIGAFAEVVKRHGIHNFEFCYDTDSFSAHDATGQLLARGPTIKDLLASLSRPEPRSL